MQNHGVLGLIKQIVYNGTRYLVLFSLEKFEAIYNRIRHLIRQKSVTCIISHNYERINVDFYNLLPLVETLTLHNVIIPNNSVLNKG